MNTPRQLDELTPTDTEIANVERTMSSEGILEAMAAGRDIYRQSFLFDCGVLEKSEKGLRRDFRRVICNVAGASWGLVEQLTTKQLHRVWFRLVEGDTGDMDVEHSDEFENQFNQYTL